MLAQRVSAGALPPLSERLPARPLVLHVPEPGLYGGTWSKFESSADFVAMRLLAHYYPLVRWKPDASGVMPGVAESWEHSEDGKTTTFRLRRGLRWSDGAPFTAADILFWWELCLDQRIALAPPEWAYAQGKRMRVVAPDSHTVVFTYDSPFYLLPLIMATGFWTPEEVLLPAHYLKGFHPDHSAAYDDFDELIRRNNPATNPERPGLGPWVMVERSATGDSAVYERNPYYYVVDQGGRQLPYIDRIETIRVQSAEAGVLYTLSGAVDAQFRQIDFRDYGLLKRFADQGGYEIQAWEEGAASWHAAFVNMSPLDPARRELFRDPSFRRGLSLGVDRNRINQVVWNGTARPQSAAITDESWHFDSERGQRVRERWTRAWAEYDPDRANRLLDQAGLDRRDADGFRLYRGEPFRLTLDLFDIDYAMDQAELLQEDWRLLGVRVLIRRSGDVGLSSRIRTGDFDVYLQHNSELDLFTFPGVVFPTDPWAWHPRVGLWYTTNGREGEAPSGFFAELIEIYERCKVEPDVKRRHDLVLDAIELQIEHGPFMIGTTGRQKSLVVVGRDVRNVPSPGILGPWATCTPGSLFPEQMFFSRERLYGFAEKGAKP